MQCFNEDDDDDYDYDYDYAFFKCSSNMSFSLFLAAEPPHPRITLDLPLLEYLLCQLIIDIHIIIALDYIEY